jgi:hypothetical protein
VSVPLAKLPDREQRVDPFLTGLADSDQDPGRERDPQLPGEPDRLQPRGRQLVG